MLRLKRHAATLRLWYGSVLWSHRGGHGRSPRDSSRQRGAGDGAAEGGREALTHVFELRGSKGAKYTMDDLVEIVEGINKIGRYGYVVKVGS